MIHFFTKVGRMEKFHRWMCTINDSYIHDKEALENVDDFDIIIARVPTSDSEYRKFQKVSARARDRFVLVDGGDDWYIKRGYNLSKAYFKRELLQSRNRKLGEFFIRRMSDRRGNNTSEMLSYWKKNFIGELLKSDPAMTIKNALGLLKSDTFFKPLNLTVGSHDHPKPPSEKEYDLFFVTSAGSAARRNFAEMVQKFADRNGLKAFVKVTGSFYGGIPWNEYIENMMSSKIAIAHPGNGFDTIRYWEIPYYGTALASLKIPLLIENNFEDMDSGIFFSGMKEFGDKILAALRDDHWETIAANGKRIFDAHHTEESRVERILSETSAN